MKTFRNSPSKQRLPLKIWLPILIGVVLIGSVLAWYLIAMPFSATQRQVRELDTKAKQLYTDHQNCVDKLTKDYKELDSNNQSAYKKAYDHCESIRQEQNNAVDEYKQLTQT